MLVGVAGLGVGVHVLNLWINSAEHNIFFYFGILTYYSIIILNIHFVLKDILNIYFFTD